MAKLVLIPGSLRKGSINKQLLDVCAAALKARGVEVIEATAAELNTPLINTDDEHDRFPPTVKSLSEKIMGANGVIIATPEYNGSISPIIKNFIDWTSRLKPHPWRAKPVLLTGTSPGYFGAVSGLLHTRTPFDRLGAYVYPQSYALPFGDKELGGVQLKDEAKQKLFEKLLSDFVDFASIR